MRPSSRHTCSQLATPLSAVSAPTVAASCPSGAPYSVTARGCVASERARSDTIVMRPVQKPAAHIVEGEGVLRVWTVGILPACRLEAGGPRSRNSIGHVDGHIALGRY